MTHRFSPENDRTGQQAAVRYGMDYRLRFMCNHKGDRAGAQFKGSIPWKCAACVKGPEKVMDET